MTNLYEGILILPMWVIYRGATDRRGPYTVRQWEIGTTGAAACTTAEDAPTLEAARALVPDWTTCIGRNQDDDPVIVEVWL